MTSWLHHPHDHFFKAMFGHTEVAADFLRHYLMPEVAALLEPNSLRIRKDSFVDPALTEHRSDLLYQVRLRDGGEGYVYVLFEHKSAPEPAIGLDLWRYLARIWEQTRKAGGGGPLPLILPVVIYHGREPWRLSTEFAGFLAELPPALAAFVPNFRYWLVDLSAYSDEAIRGEVVLRVTLLLFKYIFREELRERLPFILGLLADLLTQRSGLDYLETVLRYVAGATDRVNRDDLRRALEQTWVRGEQTMATIAEEWIQEGMQKGLQQGLQQGLSQGETRVVRRLLTRRFGPLPAWVEERLQRADAAQLERWADRVLEAATLEAVFAMD